MQKLLRELFTRYYKDVYAYLYSLCRDASLAEDLAAEVFLEAVRSVVGFRGESDPKTWLFTIARRRWYAHLRRRDRSVPTEQLADLCAQPGPTVDERLWTAELLARIRALLEAEPARTRSIVLLRQEGYSFYEIGARHGISENSARVIDFRARAKLKKQLEEEGFGDV